MIRFALLALALAAAGDAAAQLYKCTGKDGKVEYREVPCPPAAEEKKLKAPAAGPGSAGSGRLKAGWEVEQVRKMQDDCSTGAFTTARRAYREYQLRAGKPDVGFPESEFRASIDNFCGCIARRVTTSFSFEEFARRPGEISQQYLADAMSGRECKPTGIMGEALDAMPK